MTEAVDKLHARQLLTLPSAQLWAMDRGNNQTVELVMDDGSVTTDIRSVIISHYGWALHREYPEVPLLKDHIVPSGFISDRDFHKAMNFVQQTIGYGRHTTAREIRHWKDVAQNVLNDLYNDTVMNLGAYVTTTDVMDNIDLIDDPVIKEIRSNLKPTSDSIADAYQRTLERLLDPNALKTNRVAWLIKAKLVSPGQLLQGIVARGFVKDLNKQIFPNAILDGYIEGIGQILDSLQESRSASFAATANGKPLEDSEWFHRKIQLASAVIQRSHFNTDCGSTRAVPYRIPSKGVLNNLLGKYYINSQGQTCILTEESKGLFKPGDVIRLRSPMFCQHPDPSGVCEACFGALTKSIPYNTETDRQGNVGHACAVEIISRISQMMLSTKHEDASSTASQFEIRMIDTPYIVTGREGIIKLNPKLKEKIKVEILFPGSVKAFLSNTLDVEDPEMLDMSNMAGIEFIDIVVTEKDPITGDEVQSYNNVQVSIESRRAIFTKEFIEHVRKVNWTVQVGDRICVDLDAFDFNDEFLSLPFMYEDMMVYQSNVEKFLKFSDRNDRWLETEVDEEFAGRVLEEFFGLLVSKMKDLNIVHAEILLYTCMCRDPNSLDFRLPKAHDSHYFRSFEKCIEWRSISALMAYQGQTPVFKNPATYLVRNRQPHPMDSLWKS